MIINEKEDLFVVHIFNEYLGDINIFDIEKMITLFKNILEKIKQKYFINGLCNIVVYYDKNYGMILEISNHDNHMIELDVKIKFYLDVIFLIEITSDIDNEYDNIYYYSGKYYTNYKTYMDSNVIYKDTLNIICNGFKIR